MKHLALVNVTIQVNAIVYNDDENIAEQLNFTPIQVSAKDWPKWLNDTWSTQWENIRKQVETNLT